MRMADEKGSEEVDAEKSKVGYYYIGARKDLKNSISLSAPVA